MNESIQFSDWNKKLSKANIAIKIISQESGEQYFIVSKYNEKASFISKLLGTNIIEIYFTSNNFSSVNKFLNTFKYEYSDENFFYPKVM